MNPFKLIFGKSIYKSSLETYDWFLKLNTWKNFGKGILVVVILSLFLNVTTSGKEGRDIDTSKFFIAVIISIATYKTLASLIRYFRKTYPIYGTTNLTTSDRRFKTGQRTVGRMLKVIGREEIKADKLEQHKKEQLAKLIYHIILVIIFLTIFYN
jgi:hypothetical protein